MKHLKFIVLFFFIVTTSFAQQSDGLTSNLPNFYKIPYHFGFTIAGNKTDFRIHTVRNSQFPDTVIGGTKYKISSIYTKGDPGFAIGLVCDVRLHDYIRIRCTPSISFASRSLQYTMQNSKHDSIKIFTKSVESTFLLCPIELKIQSKRLNNFSAYVISGGGYALDLASNKRVASVGNGGNELDDAVKIKRDDIYFSAGAGTDFYLMYFKLGFEIKVQAGSRNLLRKENSIFTNSVDKVKSHMVVFSVTFEG